MYRQKLKDMLRSSALKDLWSWSYCVRLPLMLICLLSFVNSCCALLQTLATRNLIDAASAHKLPELTRYGLLLAADVLAIRLFALISGRARARARATFLRDLRTKLLDSLLKKQFACVSHYHSGELVNRMFSDVTVVRDGVIGIVPSLLSKTVGFIGATIILVKMDWRFIILLLLGAILGLGMVVVFREPLKSRHKKTQEAEGKLHAFLQESIENLRICKASRSEKRVEKKSEDLTGKLYVTQLDNAYFSLWMNTGLNMVFRLSWLFCMLWGGISIYRGTLTYGSLAAVLQLINYIQSPIAGAADIASQMYGTVSSAERLKELLELPEEKYEKEEDPAEQYAGLKEIRLENLSFSYGGDNVLTNLNAVVHKGDCVALTGISGGGKSTLFQILLGIYLPTAGRVAFVTEKGILNPGPAVRRMFGYVPQGNALFSGSLRENLAMFTDGVTDEEIMEAARIACIDEFIIGLDEGLDTIIGERGLGLSEGQAQRVAVARMILSRAPILLLDEATSALDEETEAKLLKNISNLRNRTCIIVTHRSAALAICNYRMHLDKGKLVLLPNKE